MNTSLLKTLLIAVLLCNCRANTPNNDNSAEVNRLLLINGDWVLKTINGKPYNSEDTSKNIELNIVTAESRFSGNDGCNQIFGQLLTINTKALLFGAVAGTKMACSKMELSLTFIELLKNGTHYNVNENKLTLYDVNEKSILSFQRKK